MYLSNIMTEYIAGIYSLKFVKVRFMGQNVVFLGECSVGAWEECGIRYLWVQESVNVN